MSGLLKKLFGSGEGKPPSPQEAIQRLRDVEEMLMKKSDYLEKKIDAEQDTARKHARKNKRVAIQALKRKKRLEKQLQQIDGTLTTIEFQRESLENASTNKEVLTAMGEAAKALKREHNNLDVDSVHNLMDEVADQQEIANEISEAISNPVGFGQDVDEDELLQELDLMEEEELNAQLLDVGGTEDLPNVPTAEPFEPRAAKSHAKEEDDDMRELEMWAS